jgi:hypothetical protein
VSAIMFLVTGKPIALSLLVGVPVGAYCGLAWYLQSLVLYGGVRVRPNRRWNARTNRYDRRPTMFDWLIVCAGLLPLLCLAVAIPVAVYIF